MVQPPKRFESDLPIHTPIAGFGPYRILVAAELSGVPSATLRAWERRYGVPVPRRTTSAYRLYTAEDVQLVRRMREMVEAGVAPSEAARALLGAASSVTEEASSEVDSLATSRERLIAAAQRYDARAIDEELTRLSFAVDAQTLYTRVVTPLLIEIGERWENGVFPIAQEHLLTEKLELAVRGALRTMERSDGPLVVLGCIDGDIHVLGLLGAALRFAAGGARVTVLGAATPPEAIDDVVRTIAPRLVGLSATRVPSSARALMVQYAKACGSTPWVLGGAAAEALADDVRSAGGLLAVGPPSAWLPQMREWLRGTK